MSEAILRESKSALVPPFAFMLSDATFAMIKSSMWLQASLEDMFVSHLYGEYPVAASSPPVLASRIQNQPESEIGIPLP